LKFIFCILTQDIVNKDIVNKENKYMLNK